MKLTRCFGVIFTSLALLFTTAPIASAASNSSVVTSRPSITNLETAIVRVKHISGYTTYFPDQNPARLTAADTKFYREYNYLLNIVNTAYSYIKNYDSISDAKLQEVIAAASDAEISCYYLFGTAVSPKTTDSSKVTTSPKTNASLESPASPNSTPNTSSLQSATSQPQTRVSTSQTTPNNTKTANTESTSPESKTTLAEPKSTPVNSETALMDPAPTPTNFESASSNPEPTQPDSEPTGSSSVLPQVLAHGATATLACGIAGTLVIRERRRTAYHPKSSSRNSHHH